MFAGVKVESSREATEAAEGKWYSSTITDDDGDHDGGGATRRHISPLKSRPEVARVTLDSRNSCSIVGEDNGGVCPDRERLKT